MQKYRAQARRVEARKDASIEFREQRKQVGDETTLAAALPVPEVRGRQSHRDTLAEAMSIVEGRLTKADWRSTVSGPTLARHTFADADGVWYCSLAGTDERPFGSGPHSVYVPSQASPPEMGSSRSVVISGNKASGYPKFTIHHLVMNGRLSFAGVAHLRFARVGAPRTPESERARSSEATVI